MLKWIKNHFRKRRYNKYMRSKEWQLIRKAVLRRDNYKCFVCDSTEALEVHHLYYEKNLYKGKPYQMITLCKKHHKSIHKKTIKYNT